MFNFRPLAVYFSALPNFYHNRYIQFFMSTKVANSINIVIIVFLLSGLNLIKTSACTLPGNIQVKDLGYSHAIISWSDVPGLESFEFAIRIKGSSQFNVKKTTDTEILIYLNPCTEYQYKVRAICGANDTTSYSSVKTFSTSGCEDLFCIAYGQITDSEWIQGVEFNTINNQSGSNYGFGNFLNLSTTLNKGQTYPLYLSPGFLPGIIENEYWYVWIDFNQDEVFDNNSELVYSDNQGKSNSFFTNIQIPATVPTGQTRMRIMMRSDFDDTDPCSVFAYGEVEDYSIQIIEDCSGFQVDISKTNAACGQNTGSANILVSGGVIPYSYAWSHDPNLNNKQAFNLAAGFYKVTVSDALGCQEIVATTIGNSNGPTLSVKNLQHEHCDKENGFIILEVNGGVPIYHYYWSHDSQLDTYVASNLSGGTYTVTLVDGNDCSSSLEVEILSLSGIEITGNSIEKKATSVCGAKDGFAKVNYSGGTLPYTYLWDTGETSSSLGNLSSGIHSVTVTDSNDCSATATFFIQQGPEMEVDYIIKNEECDQKNGLITLIPEVDVEDLSFKWSHNNLLNSPVASNLNSGFYSVTITYNSCPIQKFFQVDLNKNLEVSILGTNASCGLNNGSAKALVNSNSNNYQYKWSNNLQTQEITNLAAGEYSVTVTNSKGCSGEASVYIDNAADSFELDISTSEAYCGKSNGAIIVQPINGNVDDYNYAWSTGNTSNAISNLPGNTFYYLTVTDAEGCYLVEKIYLENINTFTGIKINVLQTAECGLANGKAEVIVTGGSGNPEDYNYKWSIPGETTNQISNLEKGNYGITVSDDEGCGASIQFTVSGTDEMKIDIETNSSACNEANGTASVLILSGESPFTYKWSDESIPNFSYIDNLSVGDYSVTVTDKNDCSDELSFSIEHYESPVLIDYEIIPATCGEDNGKCTVIVQGGQEPYSYILGQNINYEPEFFGLEQGTYLFLVQDVNGCFSELVQIEISSLPLSEFNIMKQNPDCGEHNGWIEISSLNEVELTNFQWSNDAMTSKIEGLMGNTTYEVTITDVNSCTYTESIELHQPNIPDLDVLPDTIYIYENTDTLVNISSPEIVSYEWSNEEQGETVLLSEEGLYIVTLTNADGCNAIDSTYLKVDIIDNINEFRHQTTFVKLYSNPVIDWLNIEYLKQDFNYPSKIDIYDINGRLMDSFYMSGKTYLYDTRHLPSGIYFLQIINKNGKLFSPALRFVKL